MTRQESFSAETKMRLCKKCRQLYRQAHSCSLFFDRLKHKMCTEPFPTSFSHSEHNYTKNKEKGGLVEMGNHKCLQKFDRESLKDDKTLNVKFIIDKY